MTWEYAVIDRDYAVAARSGLEHFLDEMGRGGWELVSYTERAAPDHTLGMATLIFKKARERDQ